MPAAEFVVVANRLPVDRVVSGDGEESWRRSPGVGAGQPAYGVTGVPRTPGRTANTDPAAVP